MNKIQAVRGMNDLLPDTIHHWQQLEAALHHLMRQYGYQEIRFPIVELTQLFKRSIGEVTDIVEKEMYTFIDRNEDSLSLRPEGTASCVRACLEHGLIYNQQRRLFYIGPMFRHERPQKGRYRQFHQFGVETFGFRGPDIEAELIEMMHRFWQKLGLSNYITLDINTLGTPAVRHAHREALVDYFNAHVASLDEDSNRRLLTNPLRILDSKNPALKTLIEQAPKLTDYYDDETREHFESLKSYLARLQIDYRVNPRLVRGLDYYSHTVFEWVTDALGSQNAVCAGGRYDGLVEQLAGKATPAVGFAMGLERLILLLETVAKHQLAPPLSPFAYVIAATPDLQASVLALVQQLRMALPEVSVLLHCGGGSLKSQFKKADQSGAHIALILGESEYQSQSISLKYLREDKAQDTVALSKLVETLEKLL